jgi:hypothetical protein
VTLIPAFFLPELQRFPEGDRADAIRAASSTSFDVIELLGIAAGLVAVTALTRYGTAELSLAHRIGAAFANFVVALPLLAAAVAPFHVRRVRRGLRDILRSRGRT